MKRLLLLLLIPVAHAAPFVVTDPVDPATTQCGVFLDAAPKVTIPVTVTAGVKTCKYDLASIGIGMHTVQMTAITVNDPVWGTKESAKSSPPLSFSKPDVPVAPAGLVLAP